MNLVFNEYIGFLKDKGIPIELKEGYYWLDRQIIKAYDKNGRIHKIIKVNIDDDLNVTFKKYKEDNFEIESWKETIERNKERLNYLEYNSLKLIRDSIKKYKNLNPVVLTSGGKDSSLTTHLVEKVIENPLKVFNNTTLDCADTYLHIKKEDNLMIINPPKGFYTWREENNFVGNRVSRACCTLFKEGAMIDKLDKDSKNLFFMGMRNQESNTRSSYEDEWKNEKWGNREWQGILPIRKWEEVDVWLYIIREGIDINPKYKKGYARVGCAIACPYYTKSTWVLDKYWYPKMYERWHKILEKDFIDNKKAPILNCTLKEYHTHWSDTCVRDEATPEVIKEFMEQQGLTEEIAIKYFDKKCLCCGKKLKKDDIAMTLKLYGRNVIDFKCLNCLANDFNMTVKNIKKKAKEFKNDGCSLF